MATISYRVKSIKRGPIPDDGTMSTMLTSIGDTYKDTVIIAGDAATAFNVEVSEKDAPIASYPKKSQKTIKLSLVDKSNESKVAVMGGQIKDGWWEEPADTPLIEESYQVITRSGLIMQFPKVSISAVDNDNLGEGNVGLIDVVGIVMIPDGPGVPPSRTRKYENPVVSAGNAQNITVANVNLVGTATPFIGVIAKQLWTCIGKPAAAADPVIATPTALNTSVAGLVNGVYRFQLAATDDNDFTGKATVMVTVAIP